MPTKYDLAIIGSGGGAFAAAIRASTLGKSVVMIERGTLGGTCVNTGCVPSKALIAAAGARHVAVDAGGQRGEAVLEDDDLVVGLGDLRRHRAVPRRAERAGRSRR